MQLLFFAILVLGTWFMPLIIMITLILGIIECIKRLIKKEKIRKTITQVMTKILCEVLAMIIGYYLLTYEKAKPSEHMKIHIERTKKNIHTMQVQ